MKHHATLRQGFSLVELSIVLVILGLLTGGILTGQSLIRAAELRSISTELQRYQTATQTFRDKYLALPGDMTNAESFWGTQHATDVTCKSTASTTTATCNGDGNGIMEGPARSNERYRYWQHLSNAGLIEGTYSGVSGSANSYHTLIGQNAPAGKLSNGGWTLFHQTVPATHVLNWDRAAHVFLYGGQRDGTSGAPILKSEEVWNIDQKIDDGKAGSGLVRNYDNWTTTPDCTVSGNYNLTNTGQICSLIFVVNF